MTIDDLKYLLTYFSSLKLKTSTLLILQFNSTRNPVFKSLLLLLAGSFKFYKNNKTPKQLFRGFYFIEILNQFQRDKIYLFINLFYKVIKRNFFRL
mgnify:CR=1 FL=1